MYRLENPIRDYAWGSHKDLAEFQGRPVPSPGPEAELWLGSHPSAPSRVEQPDGWLALDQAIEQAPVAWLGARTSERFGGRLPFLLKLLSAENPLSLQAHPSQAQAQAGFEHENALGIPLNARKRNYKDASHKPELIVALTRFEAMAGFRQPTDAGRLLERLAVPGLNEHARQLLDPSAGDALKATLDSLLSMSPEEQGALATAAVQAAEALLNGAASLPPVDQQALAWMTRLAGQYPGDIGSVVTLLLHHEVLEPGEALYLPAGVLHAYLGGFAVEIMANSDNVLRAGLTQKHVDRAELLTVLDFGRVGSTRIATRASSFPGGRRFSYDAGVEEFCLTRTVLLEAEPPNERAPTRREQATGPTILLATQGSFCVQTNDQQLELRRGGSLFVKPGTDYELSGAGELFSASTGRFE